MEEIKIGTKLYSYCYGPMTVVTINGQNITAAVDSQEGISAKLLEDKHYSVEKEKVWTKDSIGHVVFLNQGDVGREDPNYLTSDPGMYFTMNPDYMHAYYKEKIKDPKGDGRIRIADSGDGRIKIPGAEDGRIKIPEAEDGRIKITK